MTVLATRLREDVERGLKLVREQYRSAVIVEAECFIAIGAGDSLAAAYAAEAISGGRVIAVDPFYAKITSYLKRYASKGCWLIALSAGGRTRAVIEAAKTYRAFGGRVVVVTGDPESPLASESDEKVILVSPGTVHGIGAGRHILMLAALASVLGYSEPSVWMPQRTCISLEEALVYTGVGESYSSALYATLKSYEVFGVKSRCFHLEQFIHAPIYSVDSSIPIILFLSSLEEASERTSEVSKVLGEAGYKVLAVEAGPDPWSSVIGQAAYIVKCLAGSVERRKVEKPAFTLHPYLAELTKLIYK